MRGGDSGPAGLRRTAGPCPPSARWCRCRCQGSTLTLTLTSSSCSCLRRVQSQKLATVRRAQRTVSPSLRGRPCHRRVGPVVCPAAILQCVAGQTSRGRWGAREGGRGWVCVAAVLVSVSVMVEIDCLTTTTTTTALSSSSSLRGTPAAPRCAVRRGGVRRRGWRSDVCGRGWLLDGG